MFEINFTLNCTTFNEFKYVNYMRFQTLYLVRWHVIKWKYNSFLPYPLTLIWVLF